MKIMVIGSGGREHALAKKIATSDLVDKVLVVPGNFGMMGNHKVEVACGDPLEIAKKQSLDLVVIGPEKPLAEGLSDDLRAHEISVVGPSQSAAMLEVSKGFAKSFMKRHGIPTAAFGTFDNPESACSYLESLHPEKKVVVKADGLAAGKGVFICESPEEAKERVGAIFSGESVVADSSVVIEEYLEGRELSVFVLASRGEYIVLGQARDYKRLLSGGMGPNTGGMGSVTSGSWPGQEMMDKIKNQIIGPTLSGMVSEDRPYNGFLYFGLMINKDDVNVIEYNVRMGDPETQVILPLIQSDLVPLLVKTAKSELLSDDPIEISSEEAVHIVMASKNYANLEGAQMKLGSLIEVGDVPRESLFYSGVKEIKNMGMVNSGGRVLGVTALGESLEEARAKAYNLIGKIHFDGAFWRDDIGKM